MKRSLVTLLLGTLALAGCTTYTGTPAASPGGTDTAPAASAWPATPFDCSTSAAQPDVPDRLPTGAARISLCNEPGHEFTLVVPPDALVVGTDDIVALFNAQERPNLAATTCPADFGPAYRMVVEYPDDSVVELRGEMYGCRLIGERFGAQDVLTLFGEKLHAQRETRPATVADPLAGASCTDAIDAWLPAPMDATVAGYLCSGDGDAPALIDPADWAAIRDDWAANAVVGRPGDGDAAGCDPTDASRLVGVAASGESITLSGQCGRYEVWQPGDDEPWSWQPGPEASEALGGVG